MNSTIALKDLVDTMTHPNVEQPFHGRALAERSGYHIETVRKILQRLERNGYLVSNYGSVDSKGRYQRVKRYYTTPAFEELERMLENR